MCSGLKCYARDQDRMYRAFMVYFGLKEKGNVRATRISLSGLHCCVWPATSAQRVTSRCDEQWFVFG